MRRAGKSRKRYILATFFLMIVLLGSYTVGNIWASSNWLKVSHFTIPLKSCKSTVKIVVISDLHDHEFGKENRKLIEQIRKQHPDIILMDGDMLNQESDSSDIPVHLVERLSKECPVYYAWGNHELAYMKNYHTDIQKELEAAGAVMLEKNYVDITVRDQSIRIGGMYEYAFGNNGNNEAEAAPEEVKDFLESFQHTDSLKIMMAHRPDSFIFGDASQVWDIDLVISGHNHGGQVVLPVLGGLYGGDQGWFPKYLHGVYQKDNIQLFITSGLGSNRQALPRFNNRPEIAVLKLQPEEK